MERIKDPPASVDPRTGGASMTNILVVEDNQSNMKLVRTLLELEGHASIETGSVEEACAAIRTKRPDMVLVDIQLPGQNGMDLLRWIRQRQEFADLPVIAMTAYAMRGDRQRFLAEGFDGYISKPIDVKLFGERLQGHLETVSP